LAIRPFVSADLAVCHQLLDHEAWQTGHTLDERREWLEWTVRNYVALARLYQPPYGDRAIVLQLTNEVVGALGLVPAMGPFDRLPSYGGRPEADDNRPEFGLFWAMRTAHRGHGYATEAAAALIDYAFSVLGLGRIVATTEYENVASQAVMRRLGMTIECNPRPEPPWFQVVGVLRG
jgi:RimJ/RimL family protein N-acetyltransferase